MNFLGKNMITKLLKVDIVPLYHFNNDENVPNPSSLQEGDFNLLRGYLENVFRGYGYLPVVVNTFSKVDGNIYVSLNADQDKFNFIASYIGWLSESLSTQSGTSAGVSTTSGQSQIGTSTGVSTTSGQSQIGYWSPPG